MAFGQAAGPPAQHKQLEALEALLEARGFDSFREARHPLGLNQRQAGGKFTSDEAAELIERLEAEAVVTGDAGVTEPDEQVTAAQRPKASKVPKVSKTSTVTTGAAVPVSAASAERAAKKRRAREEEVATRMDADVLATELVNRGWCCIPPE